MCRRCGREAWCIDTTDEGLKVGCSNCDVVVAGDHATAMCFDQRLFIEASRYKDQILEAGAPHGIPVPETVKRRRDQLALEDPNYYPLFIKLEDPDWPFHYQQLMS